MIIVTADEMRRIDKYAINVLEIPSIVLMENAALKVIKNIPMEYRHRKKKFICSNLWYR